MSDRVQLGFFSFTEVPDEHADAYNRWHLLDHLPEQYQIPGIVWGQRWRAAGRPAGTHPDLNRCGFLTCYLMSEPLEPTLAEFRELGQRLRDEDRFFDHRTSRLSGPFPVRERFASVAARVDAGVVPMRPHVGVHVSVERARPEIAMAVRELVRSRDREEFLPSLIAVPGVAGVWEFAAANGQPDANKGVVIRVTWIAEALESTATELDALLEARGERAGDAYERWLTRTWSTIPWPTD